MAPNVPRTRPAPHPRAQAGTPRRRRGVLRLPGRLPVMDEPSPRRDKPRMGRSLSRQGSVGLFLGASVRCLKQGVAARVERYGLTPRQFGVLVTLFETGPST